MHNIWAKKMRNTENTKQKKTNHLHNITRNQKTKIRITKRYITTKRT